jgi:hypothetical protein
MGESWNASKNPPITERAYDLSRAKIALVKKVGIA